MRKEYPWQRPYASLSLFLSELFKSARSSKSIAARMNGLKGVHKPANKINPLEFTQVFSIRPTSAKIWLQKIAGFLCEWSTSSGRTRGHGPGLFAASKSDQPHSIVPLEWQLQICLWRTWVWIFYFCHFVEYMIQIIICSRCSLFLKDSVGFA